MKAEIVKLAVDASTHMSDQKCYFVWFEICGCVIQSDKVFNKNGLINIFGLTEAEIEYMLPADFRKIIKVKIKPKSEENIMKWYYGLSTPTEDQTNQIIEVWETHDNPNFKECHQTVENKAYFIDKADCEVVND